MLDFVIAKAVNEFGRGTILDDISYLISAKWFLFILVALLMIAVLKFDGKKWKNILVALILAMVLYSVVDEVLIKDLVEGTSWERTRPYLAHPNEIVPIGNLNTDSSFPSSHVAGTLAILMVLCFYYRKKWVWISSIVFALLMAWSRMHNGMHYPSDILGGIVFGAIYGLIAIWTSERIFRKKKKKSSS